MPLAHRVRADVFRVLDGAVAFSLVSISTPDAEYSAVLTVGDDVKVRRADCGVVQYGNVLWMGGLVQADSTGNSSRKSLKLAVALSMYVRVVDQGLPNARLSLIVAKPPEGAAIKLIAAESIIEHVVIVHNCDRFLSDRESTKKFYNAVMTNTKTLQNDYNQTRLKTTCCVVPLCVKHKQFDCITCPHAAADVPLWEMRHKHTQTNRYEVLSKEHGFYPIYKKQWHNMK